MKKHKKKIIRIVIGVVAVLAIVIFFITRNGAQDATIPVYTDKVVRGDISSELDTSGTVAAENTTTYFAPANCKIAGVEVQTGDVVKKGDMLICFDEEAVAYAQKQSELERQISAADYNATVQDYQDQKAKLAQAEADIASLEVQKDNYEKYIDDLTNGITDMTALKKADLYAKLYSVEKEINNYDLAMQTATEDTDMDGLRRKKTEKTNEMNKIQNELNMLSDYKTDYGWEDLLTQAKKDLSDCETKLQEAKADKTSAEAAIQNASKITSSQLSQEKTKLTTQDAESKYQEALNGIVAEFDGVVTDLTATEGATVQEGTQLLVLKSYDEICVEFQASKYDLEELALGQNAVIDVSGKIYNGTVSKINKVAAPNSSGVPMVSARVHIDNPDDHIYLGIEARLKITTAEQDGTLLVPVEAVNIDNDGSFCYIIENGVLAKKYVKTGVSSEEYIEITEGLNEGEAIVTSSYMGMDMAEGMAVTDMGQEGAGLAGQAAAETQVEQTTTEAEEQTTTAAEQ